MKNTINYIYVSYQDNKSFESSIAQITIKNNSVMIYFLNNFWFQYSNKAQFLLVVSSTHRFNAPSSRNIVLSSLYTRVRNMLIFRSFMPFTYSFKRFKRVALVRLKPNVTNCNWTFHNFERHSRRKNLINCILHNACSNIVIQLNRLTTN